MPKVMLPAKPSVHCLIGAASLSGHQVVAELRKRPPFLFLLFSSSPVSSPSENPTQPGPATPSSSLHPSPPRRKGCPFRPRSRFGQSLLCFGGERRFSPFFFAGVLNPSSSPVRYARRSPYMGAGAGLRLTVLVDGVILFCACRVAFGDSGGVKKHSFSWGGVKVEWLSIGRPSSV
jgi:hypothetical protein